MPNVGNTPPDYTVPLGQVRALIGDFEAVPLTPPVLGQGEYLWFGDDALQGFLNVYLDNPRRAAAQALRTIASSQALLLKKFSADDLSVDGPAISEVIRKLAAELDKQADAIDAVVDIFQLADIGTTAKFVPEGMPAEASWSIGRVSYSSWTAFDPFALTGGFEQDGGILWEQD
jgi:hypothetical protein